MRRVQNQFNSRESGGTENKMKLLICSDIHGDAESAEKILEAYRREEAEKLLLLGDILYHGPRNELPPHYAPKRVIELLNANAEKLLAVRGNCDTEVDQMVLTFPILADYAYFALDGLTVYATHGHKCGEDAPPPLSAGEILLTGHTHLYAMRKLASGVFYINPGSAAIPKGGSERTYIIYEDRCFTLKKLDGTPIEAKHF